MIHIMRAEDKTTVDQDWLHGTHSFSFGPSFDEANSAFGVLRVCNDDEIAPGRGFGPHPHSDMEIVTVVLKGGIRHRDNLGNTVVTSAGEVQRMSAGTGLIHAEYNASDTEPLRTLQIWFEPRERGLAPSFESVPYRPAGMNNALLPIVTPSGGEGAASIRQDLTLYMSRLEAGRSLVFEQAEGRRIFVLALEGALTVGGERLEARDEARIGNESRLPIEAPEDSLFMLIDLP